MIIIVMPVCTKGDYHEPFIAANPDPYDKTPNSIACMLCHENVIRKETT
jgi:hypothetical protein